MSSTAAQVFRKGAHALITGGSSGVGLAVAKVCASHGMNLILIDNNASTLSTVSSQFPAGTSVETHELDVSDLSAWKALKTAVEKDGRKLDFLHLNAGIGLSGTWGNSEYWHRIFDVNFFGIVHGVNTFIGHFDNNSNPDKQKAIVITGSKQGITNPPGNAAYNASKAAVRTLAEHLSFDLRKSSPRTSVHLLVPGWTFTAMTKGDRLERPEGAWLPDQVAQFLVKKMEAGKFYAICPDNDVDEETDRKRMTWTMGDIVYDRVPQSRWVEEYAEEAKATMAGMKLGAKQKGSSC